MLCVATVFLAPKFDPFFDTLELEITTAAILSYKRRHGLCLAVATPPPPPLMHACQRPRVSIVAALILAGNHWVKAG